MPAIKRWSLKYDKCVKCGLTKWKHNCHGLCKRCYKQEYRKTPSGRAERKRYFGKWNKTEHGKDVRHNSDLKIKYGITLEEKQKILKQQGNKCAICGQSPHTEIRAWHLDHDHTNGMIRGVLCSRCNLGLGYFKDSPQLLNNANYYLQKFQFPSMMFKDFKKMKTASFQNYAERLLKHPLEDFDLKT